MTAGHVVLRSNISSSNLNRVFAYTTTENSILLRSSGIVIVGLAPRAWAANLESHSLIM